MLVDNFFVHSKALKLKLLNYIITHPMEKLPTSKDIASTYDISDITVKKLVSELAASGYLKPNKKGGTKIINRFSNQQKQHFLQIREEIKLKIKELDSSGFDTQEILACLYSSISEYVFDSMEIVYTEKDPEMIFIGAEELSSRLKINIKPIYFENMIKELENNKSAPKAIISPFYCYQSIERFAAVSKIFPIRTTHPLEYLSNARNITYGSVVVYIAVSDKDRDSAFIIRDKITNDSFILKIYKIDEIINNPDLVNSAEMVISYKWIINNNDRLFSNIPKVMAYNKFDDKEGLLMIKSFVNSNKFGG